MASRVGTSTALLVLGMHRSGTSALAGALQRFGVPLGGVLVPPGPDNPGGYFEHAGAVTLNEHLLAELDRGWEDVRALPDGWAHAPSGVQARAAIEQLLRNDFEGVPLWAIKDPRLCRLLPLWRDTLQAHAFRVACVQMLRHPDEVAASLHARDGMAPDYAYLLWLRHVLDAERDSRGLPRTTVTYDALLAEPAASLQRVAADLGLAWPRDGRRAAGASLVDEARRHHRAEAGPAARGPRAWALQAHAELTATGTLEPGVASTLQRLVDRRVARLQPRFEGMANALARERRSHHATRALGQRTEQALAEATALSLDRLEDLQVQGQRLAETQSALGEAEALSLRRLGELRVADARLGETEAALEQATGLSTERLAALHAAHARQRVTDAALARAEALCAQRTDELDAAVVRLAETQAALAAVEGLSHQRLDALEAADARLAETQAALAAVEGLSHQRLDALEAADARLAETQDALAAVEGLSRQRLEALEAADARLMETQAALAEAQALAGGHLEEAGRLSRQLASTQAALAEAAELVAEREQALQRQTARIAATDAALQAAEALARERLEQLHDLAAQLARTEQAQHDASALALARLAEVEALHGRLARTESGLEQATRLADERGRAHADALALVEQRMQARLETLAERDQARAELEALRRTRSWRYTAWLRAIPRALGRHGAAGA